MQDDLIYDVGLHKGIDTRFYLGKGFRVLAVEANAVLAAEARQTFEREIADGRLEIVEAAIAERAGKVKFFRNTSNSEWGTIDPGFAERNERFGASSEELEVPAVTFASLLEQHGAPHYLKVDIEGADNLCVTALEALRDRPRYVSFETAGPQRLDETLQGLTSLLRSGYDSFQLVNQARLKHVRLPKVAREGRYLEHRFRTGSSGPFGAELPGQWLPLDAFMHDYMKHLRREDRWSINGRARPWRVRLHRYAERLRLRPPVGWFDIHARRS